MIDASSCCAFAKHHKIRVGVYILTQRHQAALAQPAEPPLLRRYSIVLACVHRVAVMIMLRFGRKTASSLHANGEPGTTHARKKENTQ